MAQAIEVVPSLTVQAPDTVAFPIEVQRPYPAPQGSFVRIRGLPPASSLSDGHPIGPGSWAVPLSALAGIRIIVPAATTGRADVLVTLVDIDGSVLSEARSTLVIGSTAATAAPPPGTGKSPAPGAESTVLAPSRPSPTPAERDRAMRLVKRGDEQLANGVTVISGNPYGTYLYLAYDLAAVLDDGDALRVMPVIGKGGYQNMKDILRLKGVDIGITRSDIMPYLKKTGELGPNIDSRVTYITHLFNEEMHVLAGPGINRIEDLRGKKVDLGEVGSGSQFSSRLILGLLGVKVEEVNTGAAVAYAKVKSGELAATIQISGKPTSTFSKFKLEPGLRMLPVPHTQALDQDYLPARLTPDDYPALVPQGTNIETIAVASVLATYNWPRDTDRYRHVAAFTEAFFSKFADFHKPGRQAKWRETNPTTNLRGWKRFPAAEEWLAKHREQLAAATSAGVDAERLRAQAATAAPEDPVEQDRLLQEFTEWMKAQDRR